MSDVSTNTCGLQVAAESSVETLPGSPVWFLLEPNDFSRVGSVIRTVTRAPISKARQLGKGAPVGLESGIEFSHDFTMDFASLMLQFFAMSEPTNTNTFFRAAPATSSGYTIPSASASTAAKLQWGSSAAKSLVYARGYLIAGNNGLKVLTADTGVGGTLIAVAGNTAETPPTNATVELAGIRCPTSDIDITVSGGLAQITSTTVDFTSLGLKVGQFIHVGGLAAGEQFSAGYGYLRITSIPDAQTLNGDSLSSTLATDDGTGDTVDLLFGRFIRNVDVDAAATDNQFVKQFLQFEMAYPDLGGVGTPMYEYLKGNLGGSMTLQLPLEALATARCVFDGTDTDNPTSSRKTNAATPIRPLMIEANNTASNLARLRSSLTSEANTGLTDLNITINNNIKRGRVLGRLGSRTMSLGKLNVEVAATMLFTDAAMKSAIRNNTTVTFETLIKNNEGAIMFQVPSMTVGDGALAFPEDELVTINLRGDSFGDPTFGTSFGASLFPVVP